VFSDFLEKTGTTPEKIASKMFSSIGRVVVRDQGYYSFSLRMLLKVVDVNLLTLIFSHAVHLNGDYKKVFKPRVKSS
jgi:hypothetical protein